MNFKWSSDSNNMYSIIAKVNGDVYEFNCHLPIGRILTSKDISVSLYNESVPAKIVLNNSKEYYGNLFKNDELFKSDVSLTEAGRIIESQIENRN